MWQKWFVSNYRFFSSVGLCGFWLQEASFPFSVFCYLRLFWRLCRQFTEDKVFWCHHMSSSRLIFECDIVSGQSSSTSSTAVWPYFRKGCFCIQYTPRVRPMYGCFHNMTLSGGSKCQLDGGGSELLAAPAWLLSGNRHNYWQPEFTGVSSDSTSGFLNLKLRSPRDIWAHLIKGTASWCLGK